MEETKCIVCFSQYDNDEHRPRSIPCGHTVCTECLETVISEQSRKCPECRAYISADNINEIPINFTLEGVMKILNISQNCKGNDLPECIEHQLPVSHRCTTHRSWLCQRCIRKDHPSESCKIITIWEELSSQKSSQLDQVQPLLSVFEKMCNNSYDCKKQCMKQINECNEEIARYETIAKRFLEEIQRKKSARQEMIERYVDFDNNLDNLKGKRSSYDKAVASLMSSENIREVSRCSTEVQNEAEKLELASHVIKTEVDLTLKCFKVNAESATENTLGYHRLSEMDIRFHMHALNIDENDRPMTDGILTFLDIAWPGQKCRRVYMKMVGNTTRAMQHMMLATGYCGHSYKGLYFDTLTLADQPGECLIIHEYDDKQAAPLLKDVTLTDGVEHKKKAGLIAGAGWNRFLNKNYNNALFGILLRDDPGKWDDTGFGRVTSGLDILQDIAKSQEKDKIKVVDCGVVSFW